MKLYHIQLLKSIEISILKVKIKHTKSNGRYNLIIFLLTPATKAVPPATIDITYRNNIKM